jgi:hypothetical protein
MSYKNGRNFIKNKNKQGSDVVIVSDYTNIDDNKHMISSTKLLNDCQYFSVIIPNNMLKHITVPYTVNMNNKQIVDKCGSDVVNAAKYKIMNAVNIATPQV